MCEHPFPYIHISNINDLINALINVQKGLTHGINKQKPDAPSPPHGMSSPDFQLCNNAL